MIVLKEPHTSRVLSGAKVMELRARRIKEGKCFYLADSTTHKVKALVSFGESWELSQEDYTRMRPLHLVEAPLKRYKRTYGTMISDVQVLETEVGYRPKRGAIGFARFQAASE